MKRTARHTVAMSLLIAALGPVSLARAASLVTFARGQAIVVQSVEKRGSWYYFVLEGGGEMGVPVNRVVRIEEYEAPPPSTAAPAVAVTPGPAAVPGSPAQQAGAPSAGSPQAGVNPPGAPGDPQAGSKSPQNPGANVVSQGDDDWRYRVQVPGGPRAQEDGAGGVRKAGGISPMGAGGRLQGYGGRPLPYGRRPPVVPPQQQRNYPQQ